MKYFLLPALIAIVTSSAIAQQNVGIGTNSPGTKLDINGAIALREGQAMTLSAGGASGGTNDNIVLPDIAGQAGTKASFYRIAGPNAAFSIYGIAPVSGADGEIITLVNTTTNAMTIKNNASSVSANSINTLTGADITSLPANSSITMHYNKTVGKWYVTATQNFAVSASSISTSNIVPGTNSAVTVTNGSNQVVGPGNVVVDVTTNALATKGIVPGPTGGNANQVWGTDGSGNPAWEKVSNSMLNNASVTVTAGTGLSGGGAVALGGSITLNNSAPDQTVTMGNGTGISVTGAYPNFTVTNTAPSPANTITGSGTTNYAAKFTGANAIGNSQIYDNGSAVGIGTAAPQDLLSVGATTADGQLVNIRSYSGTPASWKGGGAFGYSSATVIMGELSGVAQIGGHNATLTAWGNLALNSGGGNVGIRNASPAYPLDVTGDVNSSTGFSLGGTAASGNYLRGNGSQFVSSAIQAGDIPASSGNYIQNQTSANQAAGFRVNGVADINNGSPYAIAQGDMAAGSLIVGGTTVNYGGGSGWNSNTAGILMETLDNTEIAVHDAGNRVASLMYYQGGGVNQLTIGRNMGWDNIAQTNFANNNYAFFGPNSTWNSYLRVGGNGGGIDNYASVATTNGNLHLDASSVGPGNAMYLNFYKGTGGIYFGTGAGAAHSFFSSAGYLGVGTTGPSSNLDVRGGLSGMTDWSLLTVGDNSAQQNGMTFGYDGGNNWAWIYARTTGCCGRTINVNNTEYIQSGNGSVGIGTSSPLAKFFVYGQMGASRDNTSECCSSGDYTAYLAEATSSTGHQPTLEFHAAGYHEGYLRLLGNQGGQRRFQMGDHQGVGMGLEMSATLYVNGTGNSYLMGNTGVGTSSPNGRLDVFNTGSNGDGAVFAPDITADNNFTIQTYIDANIGGGGWANRTSYAGACCNNLALQPDAGTVSVGATSGNFATNRFNVYGFGATGDAIYSWMGNSSSSCIYSDDGSSSSGSGWSIISIGDLGYTGGFYNASDRKLKKDIEDYNGALASVMQLKAKSYHYNTDKYSDLGFSKDLQYGFIAQDIEQVFPSFVKEKRLHNFDTTEVFKTVNYVALIPVLTQAIQEQQGQINELKKTSGISGTAGSNANSNELDELKKQNQLLQEQLNAIKVQLEELKNKK